MKSVMKPRQGRRLGLVVATVVATSTSMGCTEMHVLSPVDASSPADAAAMSADASSPGDAGSPIDARSPVDAGSPMDVAVADASFAADDADIPDGHYPDGVRG